jgi:hypothetical protein
MEGHLQILGQQADGSVPMVFQPSKGKGKDKGKDIDIAVVAKAKGTAPDKATALQRLRKAKQKHLWDLGQRLGADQASISAAMERWLLGKVRTSVTSYVTSSQGCNQLRNQLRNQFPGL